MQASIPSIVGQMIVFAIFVFITMKYVWPHIIAAIETRQKTIADGLAAADRGQKALAEASTRSDDALKAARTQAQEIVAAANKQASSIVEHAREEAESEKSRIVAAGHSEVERELAQAKEVLRRQVGELAVEGASKILKREIDARAHAELLGELAARV
jgi:F-type H+-transporting ATPase subunit b